MVVKKQPDPNSRTFPEGADDWFRQFMKHFEASCVDKGASLSADAGVPDFCLVALQAVRTTLLDAGLSDEQVLNLFGHVAFERSESSATSEWTAELNQRRFASERPRNRAEVSP